VAGLDAVDSSHEDDNSRVVGQRETGFEEIGIQAALLNTTLPPKEWGLFDVYTDAANKDEYLLRPDLGRRFSAASRIEILQRCSSGNDLQIAVGDGLSVAAISAQLPRLLPLLYQESRARALSRTFTREV